MGDFPLTSARGGLFLNSCPMIEACLCLNLHRPSVCVRMLTCTAHGQLHSRMPSGNKPWAHLGVKASSPGCTARMGCMVLETRHSQHNRRVWHYPFPMRSVLSLYSMPRDLSQHFLVVGQHPMCTHPRRGALWPTNVGTSVPRLHSRKHLASHRWFFIFFYHFCFFYRNKFT